MKSGDQKVFISGCSFTLSNRLHLLPSDFTHLLLKFLPRGTSLTHVKNQLAGMYEISSLIRKVKNMAKDNKLTRKDLFSKASNINPRINGKRKSCFKYIFYFYIIFIFPNFENLMSSYSDISIQ